jgi:hypothetical protein
VVKMLELNKHQLQSELKGMQDKLDRCLPDIAPAASADSNARAAVGDAERCDSTAGIAMCGFVTDVESNLNYFERYLAISQVFDIVGLFWRSGIRYSRSLQYSRSLLARAT